MRFWEREHSLRRKQLSAVGRPGLYCGRSIRVVYSPEQGTCVELKLPFNTQCCKTAERWFSMSHRTHLNVALIAISFLINEACTKETPPPARTIAKSDRVAPSPVGTTQTVLQKTFNLKISATFPFEIPAHAVRPHLHGIFQSFAGQVHGASDDTANIDFFILTQEQQADSASSRANEALAKEHGLEAGMAENGDFAAIEHFHFFRVGL